MAATLRDALLAPDVQPRVVADCLADALQPHWAEFTAMGGGSFGDYLAKREDEVGEALLAITDERARNSGRPVIVKAYNTVRGSAACT